MNQSLTETDLNIILEKWLSNKISDRGKIAEGGMGSVRLIYNHALIRYEAKKAIKPQFMKNYDTVIQFLDEAQVTAQLNHPNIVTVYNVGVDDQKGCYFTMNLVNGQTLKDIVKSKKYNSNNKEDMYGTLRIILKISEAVAFAHSHGIIHCDLKPDNIMVCSHGRVYVMDWGIAQNKRAQMESKKEDISDKNTNSKGQSTRSTIGTPGYFPPELAEGRLCDIDERTDVFLLGGILYYCITKQVPYKAKSISEYIRKAKEGDILHPEEILKENNVPRRLCQIAMKALNKNPNKRYQTISIFQKEIESFMRGGSYLPTIKFQAGDTIFRESDKAVSAYGVIKGTCELYKNMNDEKVHIKDLGPGKIFGETAVFTEKVRIYSAEAQTDVTLVIFNHADIQEALGDIPWLKKLVENMADRFLKVEANSASFYKEKMNDSVYFKILHNMNFLAVRVDSNTREMKWSDLYTRLCQELDISSKEILRIVHYLNQHKKIELNLANDSIILRNISTNSV